MLRWLANLLQKRLRRTARHYQPAKLRYQKLHLESLENRWVPAFLTAGQAQAQGIYLYRHDGAEAITRTAYNLVQAPTITVNTPAQNAFLNNNVTIAGVVTDNTLTGLTLETKVDGGTFTATTINAQGQFSVPTSFAVNGSNDGTHTFTFRATDADNNVTLRTLTFQLDTIAPTVNTFDLAAASDTAPVGDQATTLGSITLAGKTEASATVQLLNTTFATTTSNAAGDFSFAGINLPIGASTFTVRVTDAAGNSTDFQRVINRNTTGPTFTAQLQNDTGISNTDKITNIPTIVGTFNDPDGVASFTAAINDNTPPFFLVNNTTIPGTINGNSFTFNLNTLGILNNSVALGQGQNVLSLQAIDTLGNISNSFHFTFTYDTSITAPTAAIDAAFNSGSTADTNTTFSPITVNVTTEAGAQVQIVNTLTNTTFATQTANASGQAAISGIALDEGVNSLTVIVTDVAGNVTGGTLPVFHDRSAPVVNVALTDDTGVPGDGITQQYGVNGTVTDNLQGIATFTATIDSGTIGTAVSLSSGSFTLTETALNAINGSALADGTHVLHLTATDGFGNQAIRNLTFTIDRTVASPSLTLDATTNSGSTGDGATTFSPVLVNVNTEASASVVLVNNTTGTTFTAQTANGSGVAQFTGVSLDEGNSTFTATVTDLAGNTTVGSVVLSRDVTAPILNATLQNDTGSSSIDALTNDGDVVGTVTDNLSALTLTAFVDGSTVGSTVPVSGGSFTFDGSSLADGNHTIHLVATDAFGNSTSTNVTFTLDTEITDPLFDLSSATDSGTLDDQITSFTTVTLEGVTDPGAQVVLQETGTTVTADTVTGSFSFAGVNLIEGANDFHVQATDAAGNSLTITRTITRDTLAPTVLADIQTDTGLSNSDRITNDPDITGTITTTTPIASLVAGIDGSPVTFAVSHSGNSFTLNATNLLGVLDEGDHTVTFQATDVAGNVSAPTSVVFHFDNFPSGVFGANLSTGGSLTSFSVVTINGIAEPSARVVLGSTTINADVTGAFQFTGVNLQPGANTLTFNTTDLAGNQTSDNFVFTSDQTAPTLTANLVTDTGASDNRSRSYSITGSATDDLTNISQLLASINGGSDSNITGSISAGVFTLSQSAIDGLFGGSLTEGQHTLTLTATDGVGRQSVVNVTFNYDVTNPAVVAFDLDAASDSGVTGDKSTTVQTVNLVGVTEPGASVALQGTAQTTTADSNGSFTFTSINLALGGNSFTVNTTDGAGNTSSGNVTITLLADAPPEFSSVALVSDTGDTNLFPSAATDRITSDPAIGGALLDDNLNTFQGSLNGSSNVDLSTFRDPFGVFTLNATNLADLFNGGAPLVNNNYTLHLIATDTASNSTTFNLTFTLDQSTLTPTLDLDLGSDTPPTGDQETEKATVDLNGTAEAGAHAVLFASDNVTTLGSAFAGTAGSFQFTNIALPSVGQNVFNMVVTDVAGNTSTGQATFNRLLDVTAPSMLISLQNDTGDFAFDQVTSDPTVSGFVTEFDNLASFTAVFSGGSSTPFNIIAVADISGTFVLSPTTLANIFYGSTGFTLPDGTYQIDFTATDSSSNTSVASLVFTLDTAAPVTPFADLALTSDTGASGDQSTSHPEVTVEGNTDANAVVRLINSGGATIASVQANTVGYFQFTDIPLNVGDNSFTVTATDVAGNTGNYNLTLERTNTALVVVEASTNAVNDTVDPGNSFVVSVNYSTTPSDPTLSGVFVQLYFDSTKINYDLTQFEFPTNINSSVTLNADSSDADGDSSTDFYLDVGWFDAGGLWPGNATQLLLELQFSATGGFVGDTQVNVVATSLDGLESFAPPLMIHSSQAPATGFITGTVFNDTNKNGVQNTGESGMPGWTVYIDADNSNSFTAGDPSTSTDETGLYTFNNLPEGPYKIGQFPSLGWAQTAPEYSVVLTPGAVSPPASGSGASGLGSFAYDANTGDISFELSYAGLFSTINSVHIYLGAANTSNTMVIDIDAAAGGTTSPLIGTFNVTSLTPATLADLNSGNLYVVIATSDFPTGEIGGQITGSLFHNVFVSAGGFVDQRNFGVSNT